ncbi:restriction endonuclease [Pontibacter liquoris]|uniref:restriction endonuclease n=1 Tax=Pontibacter liquoris TaxID=2905677 RepID=UPI001FA71C05|nr:restriction endonuclease [Pontibacter liquoris]
MKNETDTLEVVKSSGEKAVFSVRKLTNSLRRSGADPALIDTVLQQLEPTLYEGITTKEIYRKAFSILKKLSRATAARYSLKEGIMQLGPTGFPFEKFVAEILKTQGYHTRIGVFIDGHCVRHEIDIIAQKEGITHMIECKFHNQSGTKSDVKIPMYIHSRFKDVENEQVAENTFEVRFHQGWVVTNTRFTDDAVKYGTCMNMHLMGWDFPAKGSLKDYVNSFELYPLTCLTSLTHAEKQLLLAHKLVLCKELLHNRQVLLQAGLKPHLLENVLKEVKSLCGHLPA